MLAALSAVIPHNNALAQPVVAPTQTVTTVASRQPLLQDQQVADVRVFTREQLQALPADNLADALQVLAGVQISRTGGPGQPTSVLMRGASASNTMVLVDGIRMGSATLGQFDFANLGLSGIERIEVLRGPGATLHGADAVGGVILISTRPSWASSSASASFAMGQLGGQESAARVRRAGSEWDLQVQASREAATGQSAVRPNDRFGIFNPDADGFLRRTVAVGGGWSPLPGHRAQATVLSTRLFSRFDSADYLPPTYAPDASPDFATRTASQTTSLQYQWPIGETFTARVNAGRGEEDSRSGASFPDRFMTTRRQAGAQISWQAHDHHLWVLGLDTLAESVEASGYEARAARDNQAVVLAYSGRWNQVQVQADARQDRNSVYGSHATGRSGLRWTLSPDSSVRLQAATTFRAPSFNDLYYPGYGVSTLKPEQGRSLEAGLSTRTGDVRWDSTVWRQHIRDLIAYTGERNRCPPSVDYSFGCAANLGQAELKGMTLEAARSMPASADGSATGSATGSALDWRLGYDLTDARDDQGQPLPRRARHQWRAHADQSWAGWRWGSAVVWQSVRRESGAALKGGTKLDLQAQRPLGGGWSVQARVLNALNADIEPARDYRAPGRQAWLGVRWDDRAASRTN